MALEQLGYEHCFHMVELLKNPSRLNYLDLSHKAGATDWAAFFEGCQAAVDYPACFYYKELLAQNPTAKVILTVRDPESWYQSVLNTVYRGKPMGFRDIIRLIRNLIARPICVGLRLSFHVEPLLSACTLVSGLAVAVGAGDVSADGSVMGWAVGSVVGMAVGLVDSSTEFSADWARSASFSETICSLSAWSSSLSAASSSLSDTTYSFSASSCSFSSMYSSLSLSR